MGCGSASFQGGCSAPNCSSSWLWPRSVPVMQKLRHTWPLFVFEWERVSTLQLALPWSSRCHKENQLQGVEPCPAPCFGQVWDATGGQVLGRWACCCTAHHPAAILGREYEENSDLPDSSCCCVPKNLKKMHFRQEKITAEESCPSTTLFFKLYLYLRATCYFP